MLHCNYHYFYFKFGHDDIRICANLFKLLQTTEKILAARLRRKCDSDRAQRSVRLQFERR